MSEPHILLLVEIICSSMFPAMLAVLEGSSAIKLFLSFTSLQKGDAFH